MSKICPKDGVTCDRDQCNVEHDFCMNEEFDKAEKQAYDSGIVMGRLQMRDEIQEWCRAMHRFTNAEFYKFLAEKLSEFHATPPAEDNV